MNSVRFLFSRCLRWPLLAALFPLALAPVHGVTPEALTDIAAGSTNSSPQNLTELGGKVYFTAILPGSPNRRQLYVYDPAAAAGSQITKLSNFAGSAATTTTPYLLRAVGSKLAMVADGSANGHELWVYNPADGSLTEMSINGTWATTSSSSTAPSGFIVHSGKLYFSANNGYRDLSYTQNAMFASGVSGGTGSQLWVYDPALAYQAGTNPKRLTNLNSVNPNGAQPTNLVGMGNYIFFTAYLSYYDNQWGIYGASGGGAYGVDDQELAMYDVVNGTTTTFNLAQGSTAESFNGIGYTNQLDSAPLTVRAVVNNVLYFTANATDAPHGSANLRGTVLMKFDPATMSAPAKAAEFNADSGTSASGDSIGSMAVVGSTIYLSATSGSNGTELYSYNTSNGTSGLVTDVYAGATGGVAGSTLFAFDNRVFFGGDSGAGHGSELWAHTPSTGVTAEVADIYPGAFNSNAFQFFSNQGKLYLRATEGTTGTELWAYDSATGSTSRVTDINAGANSGTSTLTVPNPSLTWSTSNPLAIGFGTDVVFVGNNGSTGIELYHLGASAAAPAVTALSPSSGPTAGGTSVTLTGTDFTGATAVAFGSTAATSFTVSSATSITATSPAGAAGTVNVSVTTAGGTSATSANTTFTYVSAPVISSTLTASGTYGAALSTYTIAASGSPTSYSASGLPAGLSVDTATGAITGTPTATGSFNVTIGATNVGGTGTATLVLTIAKASQTISWTAISDKTVGDAAFTASATASSGLSVTYSVVAGNATISGNTVTLTGAGAVTLRAEQAGDSNYNAAVGANTGFMVAKAAATVTLGSLTATYDGSSKSASATTSPSGLTVNFTYDGSGTAPTNAGSYAVVATISDTNYQGTASGTLTIGKATATVTLAALSATYDTAAHAASATTSPSGLTVNFTYDGSSTAPTNAGSYAVVGTISNANYQGTANGTLTIGKAAATVTLGSLAPTYTGSAHAASATTSPSGLTVNFTYDGSSTAPTNAGSYAVVGTINDTNYQGSASGTLAIAKAPLTVTADAKSRSYGAADPTFTATLSGFAGSDSAAVVSGAASFTTDATVTSAVGAYTITPAAGTLSAANYSFTTFATGALTITKAPLTVAADAKSRSYGSGEPAFTATLTGFVNNETAAVVSGEAALATDALITSSVGSYTITPALGTLTATNYSFNFASGTLTVTKASLTVTANNASKIYGAANPAFTANFSGFKNNETANLLSGSPALSTLAQATSTVGGYAIEAALGTLAATNYSFAFAPGTLSVAKAPLTVTADNLSRGYGSANPAFTAVVAGFVNGDTLNSATTGAPLLTTTAVPSSAQGAYPITVTAGTLAATNYDFTLVDGTLDVTPAVLLITADDKTKVYGSDHPALTYTITGFLGSDTLAVVSGTPMLATNASATSGAGAYDITVDPCGVTAANYILTGVNGTLTIAKATLTVTADNATKVYGAANPTFTATLTGFVNHETLNTAGVTGTAALTTSATAASGVNTYAITPAAGTLAATNYAFSFAPGTLTVTKAPLTVTADNLSRTYGAANPTFTATLTGFVNHDTAASAVTGSAALTTSATAASAANTYAITPAAGTLASDNYAFTTFTAGTLTVAKAPLTITADAKSRLYGDANPPLTATLAGFVNHETLATSGITGAPALSTAAATSSNVGSYAIDVAAGSLTAANYAFTTFTDGALAITKAPLTVTANNATKVYGAANPGFSATFSGFKNSDTAAAVTGAAAFSTAADATSVVGPYAVNAAFGSLAATNYSFTFAPGTLSVTKATLTVTADNLSRGYGSANPTFTAAVSGFVNGDTLDSATTGAPVLGSAATLTSVQGTYPITAATGTLAAANYDFALVDGTLTVTKAVLTVTADHQTKIYGGANPALTHTITGYLNNDTAAVIAGLPVLATTATATSPVASYAITTDVSGLSAANYIFTAAGGTLTVTKAPLTVTADAKSKVYGDANPTFTATLSGFVNGETLATAGVSGSAAFNSTATSTSGVGSYTITPVVGTFTAANYAFTTFVDGALTVAKAPLTLAADNASRVYGAANPAFTATLSGFVNGETLATSGVTGSAAFTTPATTASAVGNYGLVPALGTLAADNYSFATFVDGALAVTAAQLTVAADEKTKTYGATNPALTATITGFVNGDTLATAVTGTPALATSATTTSGAGTYAIAAAAGTLASPNYSFAFAPGTLTVNKAVLTVAAENKTCVYQTADPAFTVAITGFADGDTAATALTGAPALATTATSASGVGSYPITPSVGSLAAANYTFTFANGALTITPALAEVALGNLNQIYTGQARAVSATTTPASLPVALTYGGASAAPTNAGSYPVTAAIADPNYTGGASGVLTVGKASQSLSFGLSGSSLTVGGSIALSATASSGLPVTFSLASGNASLAGTTLIVNDTSSVVVRATQAGSENFLPVSAEQTLTGAAKRAQTIAFAPIDEHAVEEGSIVLDATATSGLPVSFVVLNGPAIVQGNVLTFTGVAGAIAVGATQGGDAVWAAAPSVQRTFEVTSNSPDIFFGQVGDGSNQKIGEVAAALPPKSNAGTLMVVAPAIGVNAVLDFKLEPDGSFVSTVVVLLNEVAPAADGTPPRAAAMRMLTVRGRLVNGALTGRIEELNLNFSSTVQPRAGNTSTMAGYYQSNSLNSASGSTASIVGSQGQMLVVASTPRMTTGAAGTVDANGRFNVAAPGAMIRGTVDAPTTTVSGTIALTGQEPVSFSGLAQTTVRTDRLINLSSRVRVGPADGRTLITGFVIGGAASKRVLLRAIGPALSDFGVGGALGNPRLELYNAAGERILENDDWNGSETAAAFAQVGAFGLGNGTRDAALLATLAPGAYTMHVRDGGETGIALAEIYDASPNPQTEYQRLINISSRGTVESGEGVLIGGFVVTGNAPKRVLVRGVGPSLGAFGVAGTLADPRLAVYRGEILVAQNNDWGTPTPIAATQVVATAAEIATAAQNSGAFAFAPGTRDSAVVVTLAPGAYTAQVTSADGTSGVGLVEIYEMPE